MTEEIEIPKPDVTKLTDPFLLEQLKRIKKLIREEDNDFVIVIEGDERIGKSTLALIICLFIDPLFSLFNIVFFKKFFIRVLRKLKKYSALLYDEAGLGLYKRDASTRSTKDINKILMTVGQRNLLLVFCLPAFKDLDPYLRTHRVDVLIRVVERGYAKVYSKSKIKKIKQHRDGAVIYPECEFAIHFKKMDGEFYKEYAKHKKKQLADYLRILDVDDEGKDKGPSIFERIIDWSRRYPSLPPKKFMEANPDINPAYVYKVRTDNRNLWKPQT